MAASRPRVLRIGVLLRDQLVEERLFDGATPVTFGHALRCALSVPADGVPREHLLFTRAGDGRFVLHASPGMEVRLGHAGALTEARPGEPVVIEPGARGRLRVGEATLLFQELAAPPVAPRMQLPASIRGTFSDRIDRRLAVIIGGSLAIHVGIAAWAWATDADVTQLGEPTAAVAYRQDTIDVTLPDPVEAPAVPAQPGTAVPVAPIQTPPPIVRPAHVGHAPPAARDPSHLDEEALRMASILTGAETAAHGPGGMNHRQPGADLDKQLEEIRSGHHEVTIGDETRGPRVDPARIGTGPAPLPIDDPRFHPVPGHHELEPGRIKPGPVQTDEPTTLTPDAVLDKIGGAYMTGLQRCYRKGLTVDAALAGKIGLTFTVDIHGRVTEPSATGVSAAVDDCVAGQMATWHFTVPRSKDGEATEATFHLSLALQPS